MTQLPIEIDYFVNNMPFPVEIYNLKGELVCTNKEWRELWQYFLPELPSVNIFKSKILIKTGVSGDLLKVIKDRMQINTNAVLCEIDDMYFSSAGIDKFFKFHIFPLTDSSGAVIYVANLIKNVSKDVKQVEKNRELVNKKDVAPISFDILEAERKRVAQELHDVVGQKILLAKLNIELFQKKYSDNSTELKDSIEQIISISKEIKSIIHSLHPVVIEKYSLIDALDLLVHEFMESSSIKAGVKYFGNPEYNSIKIDINIYRIIQEALSNIAKHSNAKNVEIECHFTEKMIVGIISDDGNGFDQKSIIKDSSKKYSYGLTSMKERAKSFGGELTIDSFQNNGTKVLFQIPLGKIS